MSYEYIAQAMEQAEKNMRKKPQKQETPLEHVQAFIAECKALNTPGGNDAALGLHNWLRDVMGKH